MIIYRPHRGGLEEALREAREFENTDEMKRYIVEHWKQVFGRTMFEPNDLVLNENEPGVNDSRCGWEDVRHVCVKKMGAEVYAIPQCIGMWATKY